MPKTTDAQFIDEKNQRTNEPIWLYRLQISDDPGEDIFLTNQPQNVSYYRDVATPQIYSGGSYPIKHMGISSNREGEVPTVILRVGNANRAMQAYIEYGDALRGNKVTIRQVWREHLDDSGAYIEDVFWIDAASSDLETVEFRLTGQLDILQVALPRRRYTRKRCQWLYKGRGCWLECTDESIEPSGASGECVDGWAMPAGFEIDSPDTCDKSLADCERHNNKSRWGAFPGVPSGKLYLAG